MRGSDARDLCVFIAAGPSTKLFAGGGGGYWRTCATRDDEPIMLLLCVFITAIPITSCSRGKKYEACK